MYLTLKKSKITAWWVARQNNKLTFVNISSKEELPDDLVVIGFMKESDFPYDLAMSQNNVVKVTENGVITAKGSFYPFEEAHALYILFLENANTTNIIEAFNWELKRGRMIADIIKNGEIKEGVNFDFDSYHENRNDIGYSYELKSDVVVSPFSRRGACMTLCIPREVKYDMRFNAEFVYESEKIEHINCVKHFINGG